MLMCERGEWPRRAHFYRSQYLKFHVLGLIGDVGRVPSAILLSRDIYRLKGRAESSHSLRSQG